MPGGLTTLSRIEGDVTEIEANSIEQNVWVQQIRERASRFWSYPPYPDDFACVARVHLADDGIVKQIAMRDPCPTAILDRSVGSAIWKASPLPPAPKGTKPLQVVDVKFCSNYGCKDARTREVLPNNNHIEELERKPEPTPKPLSEQERADLLRAEYEAVRAAKVERILQEQAATARKAREIDALKREQARQFACARSNLSFQYEASRRYWKAQEAIDDARALLDRQSAIQEASGTSNSVIRYNAGASIVDASREREKALNDFIHWGGKAREMPDRSAADPCDAGSGE